MKIPGHAPGFALALQDGQRHMLLGGHFREQPGDLKRTHEPGTHTPHRTEAGDILAVHQHPSGTPGLPAPWTAKHPG
eukprot:gene13183-16080_t